MSTSYGDFVNAVEKENEELREEIAKLRGDAEPVAWMRHDGDVISNFEKRCIDQGTMEMSDSDGNDVGGWYCTPLYTHPPQALPDGWQQVMKDLSDELESEVEARRGSDLDRRIERDLITVREARAMLAAAPNLENNP